MTTGEKRQFVQILGMGGVFILSSAAARAETCTPLERTFRSDLVPISMRYEQLPHIFHVTNDGLVVAVENVGTEPTRPASDCVVSELFAHMVGSLEQREVHVRMGSHTLTGRMPCAPLQPGARANLVMSPNRGVFQACQPVSFTLDTPASGAQFGCNVTGNDTVTFYYPDRNRLCSVRF